MNNNIQCSIESSTTKIELNSAVDGVFLVPELEGLAGLPEIRTTSGVNAGYDGGWTSAQNYDARLISIRGVIANPDISKVEDKRRAIASLLGQGRKEQLTLRFTTEAGNAYAISVRTISCEMALQRVLTTQEFLIQLRADDPLIYDDGTTGGIAAILQPQRALGGFEINFGLPLAIGGGAEDTVVDNGNETVYPVIKLYGALHSPTVVNRTTNQQMQILADLQYSIDWHTYRSTTGDYILVNDGLNGAPMTLSQLTGNAEQTTYSGKNLFPIPETQTLNGITLTHNADGTFNLIGTSTAATEFSVIVSLDQANIAFGEQLTLSTTQAILPVRYYVHGSTSTGGWKQTLVAWDNPSPLTKTVAQKTADFDHIKFVINISASGTTVNYTNVKLMVEKGSTATAYEPYVGGIHAPNPDYPQPISTVTGENVVKIEGKNLCPDTSEGYWVGSAGTNAGRTANDSGVAIPVQPNTYYTVSTTATQARYRCAWADATTTVGGASLTTASFFSADNTSGSHTGSSGSHKYLIINATDLSAIQLELGSTATAYEPYQGQSYEVNLGKNLFDKDNANILNAYIDASHTSITSNSNNRIIWIQCQPNTTYTLQKLAVGTNWITRQIAYTTQDPAIGVQTYGMADIMGNDTSKTYMTGADAKYLVIRIWVSGQDAETFDAMLDSVQIELGSTATAYEPYQTPIELAKVGTYQDRIYKDEGKWYIEKQVGKVVFNGSTTLSQLQASTNTTRVVATIGSEYGAPLSTVQLPLCDHFTGNSSVWSTDIQGTYIQSRYTVLRANNATVGATLDSFKTWLTSHPTTVYYALATPTTTEITDETLRAQLNFLASLYEGENNISLVGTGAQGEMAISYATDYTVNQDVITIDSQARTITLNGQDVYHLKTSESEFLVLAPGENKLYLTSEVSDDSGYAEVKFKQGYLSI